MCYTTKPRAELVRAITAFVAVRRGELPLREELEHVGHGYNCNCPSCRQCATPAYLQPQHSGTAGSEKLARVDKRPAGSALQQCRRANPNARLIGWACLALFWAGVIWSLVAAWRRM